ncbi:MAG TPA: hypothetical protein VGP72_16030 [Planctomycetota bacterium]|jgi:plasmid stability protein
MSTLALNNIPDDLYRRLEVVARAKRRTVGEEALDAIEKGLATEESATQQSGAFRRGYTLKQLAELQQVVPPATPDDLFGDWPAEDSIDQFLASVHEARQ